MATHPFDHLSQTFAAGGSRRGLLRLLANLPLSGPLALILDDEKAAARRRRQSTRRRRTAHRDRLQAQRQKPKRKPCAPAGQLPNKKRKRCCPGLVPDGSGVCVSPSPSPSSPPCVPSCAGKDCGPDGCGGSCGSCVGGTCTAGTCLCPSGTKNCGGACFNIGSDPRNCGDCGRRCHLNEQCLAGRCTCVGSNGNLHCGPGQSCCPEAGYCTCTSDPNRFHDVLTCQAETSCPTGTTPCIATSNTCIGPGQGGPARACCPSGTTCTVEGTCLL